MVSARAPRSARWTSARSPIRCEPCPPTGVDVRAAARRRRARRARTAGGPRASVIAVGERAPGGRPGVRAAGPSSGGCAGSTNTSKETYDETGLPGQREDRGRVLADDAEALRLARLHRDPAEPHRAERRERLLDDVVVALATRRPLVTTRSARTSWSRERVEEGARLVGDDADPVGDARRPRGRRRRAGRSCRRRSSRGRAACRARAARSRWR